jgi:peptide/nickel transport system substrate-binding protein
MNTAIKKLFLILLVPILFAGCKGSKGDGKTYKDQVVQHELSDAQGLNPITTSDVTAADIKRNIFQTLLEYDYKTLKTIPLLAKALPEEKIIGNGMEVTFELRPEAKWDNGQPITVDDIILSLKLCKAPKITNDHLKPYVEFITDIRKYEDNPRKFTFVCSEIYMLATHVTGSLTIVPEYIYDPNKVLRKFTLTQLQKPTPAIENDKDLAAFAEIFNSEPFNREADKIIGSGPYKYISWETGQRIILERKKDWWGDKVAEADKNVHFEAFPKKLIFETINDFNTALTALKAGKIDIINVTPVKEYIDLDKSDKFKANFKKSEPLMLSYQYIGLNGRDPLLNDVKVRQALAKLVDVDNIIEKVLYGKGQRVLGDIYPINQEDYATDLEMKKFDIEAAKAMLAEAGWKDTDNDGILDKVINGQKKKFELTYNYNEGNPIRQTVGLMTQSWFQKAGIKLEVKSLEWSIYLDELKKGNIQMFYGGWVSDPKPNDPKQIWGTESRNGGSNYVGFGDAKTDALIAKIRAEIDPVKRSALFKEWQHVTYDDGSYIFLYQQKFRNCIHQRFENIQESSYYPGFHIGSFKVKKGYKVSK